MWVLRNEGRASLDGCDSGRESNDANTEQLPAINRQEISPRIKREPTDANLSPHDPMDEYRQLAAQNDEIIVDQKLAEVQRGQERQEKEFDE